MADIDLLLWNKVKSGDTEAYELLFRKYYPSLCLFAKRYVNDMDTAREVIQDLFIYLWEQRKELTVRQSFKSYVFRAAQYNCIRRKENDRKTGVPMSVLPETTYEDVTFHNNLEYAELKEKIMESIDGLPEQCQKVFRLSRFDQLKYSEIALQLGISVKTVETQISKAMRMIQQSVDDFFI